MFLNKNDSSSLSSEQQIHPTVTTSITESLRNFILSHNSTFIQTEQLKKFNPQFALILHNFNNFQEIINSNETEKSALISVDGESVNVDNVETLDFVVKISKDVPLDIAVIMFGYIMPLLLIITIIFNSAIVIVLSQKHMRTPTNMVLLSMAIFDMLTLMFPSPWYFYAYFLGRFFKLSYFVHFFLINNRSVFFC